MDEKPPASLAFYLLCAWNDTTPDEVSPDFWTSQDERARHKWERLELTARVFLTSERKGRDHQ